jgi:hypothetical protein
MATSNLLGGDASPTDHSATGIDSLGPSDASDSGSDSIGVFGSDEMNSDSDRHGTGVRAGIDTDDGDGLGLDIRPDHVEGVRDDEAADFDEDADIDDVANLADLDADDPDALDGEDAVDR